MVSPSPHKMCSLQCVRWQIRERLVRQVDLARGGVNILGRAAAQKLDIWRKSDKNATPTGNRSRGYHKSPKGTKKSEKVRKVYLVRDILGRFKLYNLRKMWAFKNTKKEIHRYKADKYVYKKIAKKMQKCKSPCTWANLTWKKGLCQQEKHRKH